MKALIITLMLFTSTAYCCDEDGSHYEYEDNTKELKELQEEIELNNQLQMMNYQEQILHPQPIIYQPRMADGTCGAQHCLPRR